MIDPNRETLISITRIPRAGTPPSQKAYVAAATAYRWCSKGVRGRRLETILAGGRRFTSAAALDRFYQQSDSSNPSVVRKEEIAKAQEQLKQMGI